MPFCHEAPASSYDLIPKSIKHHLKKKCTKSSQFCVHVMEIDGVARPVLFLHIGNHGQYEDYGKAALLKNFGAQAHEKTCQLGFVGFTMLWDVFCATAKHSWNEALDGDDLKQVVLGSLLKAYGVEKSFQKTKRRDTVSLLVVSKRDRLSASVLQALFSLQSATHLSCDLANGPPNICTPEGFARVAQKQLSPIPGVSIRVHKMARLKQMGMHLLLAVGQGSAHPPVLLEVSYQPRQKRKSTPKVALVGKGLTFDSGGYCLKPYPHISEMKYDMCGGALMLAVTQAAAQHKLPVAIKTLIPLTDNMIGSRAVKPGDVCRSLKGVTVEVLNTDAEGRLILADALTLACRWKPRFIIDAATLTGAVLVALGSPATGMMGTDPKLLKLIHDSAHQEGERVWELPLLPEYDEWLSSDVADIKNISLNREAGSSLGGAFLKRFVSDGLSWVHLDIAGSSFNNKNRSFYPEKGASGALVSTLVRCLTRISQL